MPNLFELFSDKITWAFFGLIAALWALEAVLPARRLPAIAGHHLRGLASLLVFFLVSSYVPYLVAPVLAPLQLMDLSGLGLWGAALAMIAYQALGYAYHRAMHESDVLFRAFHQMHHSAERLDVASAFFFAPLDMIGWTLVSSVALTLVGVTPAATVVFVLAGTFLSVFQHANLRTPQWLGFLIQRPESHSHHHARGVHRNNYADLPIIDLLFGTFVNPKDFAPATGYYDGASARLGDMLRLKDVTTPAALTLPQRAPQRAEAKAVLGGG